jgi:hypothetical protein
LREQRIETGKWKLGNRKWKIETGNSKMETGIQYPVSNS